MRFIRNKVYHLCKLQACVSFHCRNKNVGKDLVMSQFTEYQPGVPWSCEEAAELRQTLEDLKWNDEISGEKSIFIFCFCLLLKISFGVISSSRPSRTSNIKLERGKNGIWPIFEAALRSARRRSGAWMPCTARSMVKLRYCSRSKADFSSFSKGVLP